MTTRHKARVPVLYTVWAKHPAVRDWIALVKGVSQERAVNEVVTRQDRDRRSGNGVKFTVTADGSRPGE